MSKKFNPQTKEEKDLKEKIKDNAGDIFNELHYIYKERYSEEKNGLNTQDTKKIETRWSLWKRVYRRRKKKQIDKKSDKK